MRKRTMTWAAWVKKYKPIKNKLSLNASIDGLMFETYGKEVLAVEKARIKNPQTIWTVIDTGSKRDYAIPGFHYVNRLGYFITKIPCTSIFTNELSVKI